MFKFKELFKSNNYISRLDQFLKGFDQAHPQLSASQYIERKKYQRIYQLRDNKITITDKKAMWDQF